jgi:hypothetical protein
MCALVLGADTLLRAPCQSRRREQFRLQRMDEEAAEAEAQRVYEARVQNTLLRLARCSCPHGSQARTLLPMRPQEKQAARSETADARTERNRLKRLKKKAR